jgi:membrane-associated phospholipid phosphatase
VSHINVDFINWMQSTFGQGWRPFFDVFSTWGGPAGWLLIRALAFWLSGSIAGLRVGFSTAIATITNDMLKWTFALPRPYYVNDQVLAMKASSGLGMPSGHAQGVAANWGAVAYFLRQRWCVWLAIIFILCTGAARVYYGLHTPAQVLAGWSLGGLAVVAVAWLEDPIVRWCRDRSLPAQVSGALVVTAIIVLAGYGISVGLRGDFQPPLEWKSHWQATVDRLVAEGDEDAGDAQFRLIEPAVSLRMGGSFLGYAVCGLWFLHRGEINPTSNAHRCANVLLGVPLVAVIVLVAVTQLAEVMGEVMSYALLALVSPPLIGVVIPGLTGRIFSQQR